MSEPRRFERQFRVFSPRWGHDDRYNVEFAHDGMRITQGVNSAECKAGENGDPEWSGNRGGSDHPLMAIFSNDDIYAPALVPFALEYAWGRWRDGAVTDDELGEGLTELFAWIDQTARAKPKSKVFEGGF